MDSLELLYARCVSWRFVGCDKNAGGQPPATSTALLAERYLFYITTKGVLSRYNYTRTCVLSVLVGVAILRTVQPSSADRCSLGFTQIWKAVNLGKEACDEVDVA